MCIIGNVYKIPMNEEDGITVKDDYDFRNKYIIVLGVDGKNNILGVVVTNSQINLLHHEFDFQYEIKQEKYEEIFEKDSYVDCSKLYSVYEGRIKYKKKGKINIDDYDAIVNKVRKHPDITKRTLKKFNLL